MTVYSRSFLLRFKIILAPDIFSRGVRTRHPSLILAFVCPRTQVCSHERTRAHTFAHPTSPRHRAHTHGTGRMALHICIYARPCARAHTDSGSQEFRDRVCTHTGGRKENMAHRCTCKCTRTRQTNRESYLDTRAGRRRTRPYCYTRARAKRRRRERER